jgi:hypothetical protein
VQAVAFYVLIKSAFVGKNFEVPRIFGCERENSNRNWKKTHSEITIFIHQYALIQ